MASKQAEKEFNNIVVKKADQKRTPAPDFFRAYSNNLSISMSTWDVTVVFGRVLGVNRIEEQAEILMSKELAKMFVILMTEHVKKYEAEFGEIKIPDLTKLSFEDVFSKGASNPKDSK